MKYVIYEMANIADVNFAEVFETNDETIRLSLDGMKTVLKFSGDVPDFLIGLQTYTHTEILAIMHTPEWQNR
jgi:hypothetical protein